MKRFVSGFMLILFISSTLTLMFNVQPVKGEWTGTVYIRADGSIDPPDAPITTYDRITYTLIDNIVSTADGIVIERDNIILDGLGYVIQGSGGYGYYGVRLDGRSNVRINNLTIKLFYRGIYLRGSSITIAGNYITANPEGGIYLLGSNNAIIENNITDNGGGIYLFGSSNNISRNNIIKNIKIGVSGAGIFLSHSSNNSIDGNMFIDDGLIVSYSCYQNSVVNNTVNGRPLVYLEGVSNYAVGNAGQVILVRSTNIKVEGLNLSRTSAGIQLWETNSSAIFGNYITDNFWGIWVSYSSYNCICMNNIIKNKDGIRSDGSLDNNIFGNNITTNTVGIRLDSYSSHNNIFGNNITANAFGISVEGGSLNNVIYHNNFENKKMQVGAGPYTNIWDDRYPSGGNYWSDYTGVDLYSGPYQNVTGSDGIGDTPYVINENNIDHYPLMKPYGIPLPPIYLLTITTTVGGTTNPAPGTYCYTVNSTVEVTAIPDQDYVFDHWELNGSNVGSANPYTVHMDSNYILKAYFVPAPAPLTVSISPTSASILVGQQLTFTSTVTGGTPPYTYQWYLNGEPVAGANSTSWTFKPTAPGIYYVFLKVTDAKGSAAQSDTARITVVTVPVGGYSISIQLPTTVKPVTIHIALLTILTTLFIIIRQKTRRKHRQ